MRTSLLLISLAREWLHLLLQKKKDQMKSILRTLNAMMIITEQTMEEMFVKCTAVARAQKVVDGFGEIDLNESVFQRINAQFHWIIFTGDG